MFHLRIIKLIYPFSALGFPGVIKQVPKSEVYYKICNTYQDYIIEQVWLAVGKGDIKQI